MDTRTILKQLQQNKISIEEAEGLLKRAPFETIDDFAKIDTHRKLRNGVAEVVYCEHKSKEHLQQIFQYLYQQEGSVFGTRASVSQYQAVKEVVPEISYHEQAKVLQVLPKDHKKIGCVAVCTAGTADIAVAEEAALTAEFCGAKVIRTYDVGVSGIHRLLSHMDLLQQANCIISVAGMEGALTSVLGGLVEVPVIGVPTSVGYGVSKGGETALRAMLSSCANGVAVVNIDNGYGAGYLAAQINRLGERCNG